MDKRMVQESDSELTREMRDDLISRHLGAASISTRLGCHRLIDALLPTLRAPAAQQETAAEEAPTQLESLCANCGKPASAALACISEYPEEGEWFCSPVCFEQHSILECPHLTHCGYRHPAEAARLIAAESALRSLAACIAGDDLTVEEASTVELEGRIRKFIDQARKGDTSAVRSGEVKKVPLFWVRPRSDGGYDGPLPDDRIDDVRKRSGAWVALVAADDGMGAPVDP